MAKKSFLPTLAERAETPASRANWTLADVRASLAEHSYVAPRLAVAGDKAAPPMERATAFQEIAGFISGMWPVNVGQLESCARILRNRAAA